MAFTLVRALRATGLNRVTPVVRADLKMSNLRLQYFKGRSPRRHYASETTHGHKQSSSDLPWLIAAIAVTVPSCAYLLTSDSKNHHDADHHSDHSHTHTKDAQAQESDDVAPEHGEEQEESFKASDGGKAEDEAHEENSDEAQDESSPEGESQMLDTPESRGNVEGVRFKGATKQGGDSKAMTDTRTRIPDPKGGFKKRIDSGYANSLGVGDSEDDTSAPSKDKPVSAKQALSQNEQSGKQAGFSNTETKHSTDITSDPQKSKKGEGVPETAKLQGTVDPNRPPAESKDRGKRTTES